MLFTLIIFVIILFVSIVWLVFSISFDFQLLVFILLVLFVKSFLFLVVVKSFQRKYRISFLYAVMLYFSCCVIFYLTFHLLSTDNVMLAVGPEHYKAISFGEFRSFFVPKVISRSLDSSAVYTIIFEDKTSFAVSFPCLHDKIVSFTVVPGDAFSFSRLLNYPPSRIMHATIPLPIETYTMPSNFFHSLLLFDIPPHLAHYIQCVHRPDCVCMVKNLKFIIWQLWKSLITSGQPISSIVCPQSVTEARMVLLLPPEWNYSIPPAIKATAGMRHLLDSEFWVSNPIIPDWFLEKPTMEGFPAWYLPGVEVARPSSDDPFGIEVYPATPLPGPKPAASLVHFKKTIIRIYQCQQINSSISQDTCSYGWDD